MERIRLGVKMKEITYYCQNNESMIKAVTYGFQSDFSDRGAVTLGTGTGVLHFNPEYKVSSILIMEHETLIDEEKQIKTGRLKPLREYERFDVLEKAKDYYEMNREQLLQLYEGRYIAILGDRVIDNDDNFNELANRVYSVYGYITIYMPKVVKDKKIFNIPSPIIEND
ncbi:DUF5678 domain-containing protein [Omnitrophica bacterium]|nr:DUF5678 domain-containing protein [Candidatus Omnitrophota bacterium]